MAPLWIYHLTTPSELRRGMREARYQPDGLARDGFVHCASRDRVLEVAKARFASEREPLLLLEIDPGRLRSPLRYEPPAHPPPDADRERAPGHGRFPHVYGPIDRDAIVAVGRLERRDDGFAWPTRMQSADEALD